MACHINRERRRTDDTWLSHLACHERRMRGSAPDSCHNSRGDGKSCDIRRAGIGPNQNHGAAAGCQTFGAPRIKGRAADRDPCGCTRTARNGLMNID